MTIDPQWESRDWYIGPKSALSLKDNAPYNLFGLKGRSIDDLQAAWEGGPEADPMKGQSLTGLIDQIKHLGQPAQPSSTPPLHLTRERGSAPQWVEDLPGRGVVYVTLLGLSPQESAALRSAVSVATMSSY